MYKRIYLSAALTTSMLLQACGGSMLGTSDADDYKLIPEEGSSDPTAARPSENAPVTTTDGTRIYTADGTQVLLRGINLDFGADPLEYINAIDEIHSTGANTVRLIVYRDTHPANLEAALNKIAENNMLAELTLKDDALECNDDQEALNSALNDLWLGEWRDVIALDSLQPHILLNIASGWGPDGIYNGYSTGYRSYFDSHKAIIRKMRTEGFNFPLVISAPGCGSDYWAFDGDRAKELMAADDKKNLIISVHGYGNAWKDGEKTITAIESITEQGIPVVMSEFGGSGVGEIPVKHKEIMVKGAGDYYADLEVTWVDPADKAGILMPLEEAVDLTHTDISFDVRVDDAYIDNGLLGFQMYVRDTNDMYANMGWIGVTSLTKSEWTTFSYTIFDLDSFGWVEEGFDLTSVSQVGVELVANGKPVEVGGAIDIDHFKIIESNEPVTLLDYNFDDGIEGWSVPWGDAAIAHDATNGALEVTRTSGEFVVQLQGLGDATGYAPETEISVRVFVPAGYAGDFVYFTFFNNDSGWVTTQYLEADSFTFGDWSEIIVTTPPEGDGAFPINASTLGIQMGNLTSSTEPVLFDDLILKGPSSSEKVEGIQYESEFSEDTDGFGIISWGNSGTVTVDGGNLSIAANEASATRLTVTKENWANEPFLDVTSDPFTIKTRIMIPSAYSGLSEFRMQIFFQDHNWENFFTAYELTAESVEMVYDEWIDIVVPVDFPDGFDPGVPRYFGFDFCADSTCDLSVGGPFGTTNPILMDYFIVEGLVPVEKEEVVYALVDFFYMEQFENLTVDFVEGGLDQDELQENILGVGTRSDPFSWMAWSWYGNVGDNMAWDMVTDAADAEALTERGEEIVNGKGGLLWQ